MAPLTEIRVALDAELLAQAQQAAQQLQLSPDALVAQALAQFLGALPPRENLPPSEKPPPFIRQGDLYWLSSESAAGIPHPHVVLQDDLLNRSRLPTVVVCALTSNLKRLSIPGNLLLAAGEGGLARQSVVEVAKVAAVNKGDLGPYIGRLPAPRIAQILAGMRFQQMGYFGG